MVEKTRIINHSEKLLTIIYTVTHHLYHTSKEGHVWKQLYTRSKQVGLVHIGNCIDFV